MSNKKSKGIFSKFVVFLIITLNVWFADRVLDTIAISGIEPSVLIGAWFLFTGTELGILFGIKIKKINKKEEGDP